MFQRAPRHPETGGHDIRDDTFGLAHTRRRHRPERFPPWEAQR